MSYTKPHLNQSKDILQERWIVRVIIDSNAAVACYKVEQLLAHRKQSTGYQSLALLQKLSVHEAQWQPAQNITDSDRTSTEAFSDYILLVIT